MTFFTYSFSLLSVTWYGQQRQGRAGWGGEGWGWLFCSLLCPRTKNSPWEVVEWMNSLISILFWTLYKTWCYFLCHAFSAIPEGKAWHLGTQPLNWPVWDPNLEQRKTLINMTSLPRLVTATVTLEEGPQWLRFKAIQSHTKSMRKFRSALGTHTGLLQNCLFTLTLSRQDLNCSWGWCSTS